MWFDIVATVWMMLLTAMVAGLHIRQQRMDLELCGLVEMVWGLIADDTSKSPEKSGEDSSSPPSTPGGQPMSSRPQGYSPSIEDHIPLPKVISVMRIPSSGPPGSTGIMSLAEVQERMRKLRELRDFLSSKEPL